MSVIGLVVILIVLGLIAWLVSAKLPINTTFKTIIYVVLVVIAVFLCLSAFGVWDEVRALKVPKV